ncbi:hypothetical protein Tco_0906793 [Tanacetum coccineum]|uniref:Uncharacterized protein n=1 Tax=Tanacetum coccineum TaxID=301880 RepID=A0ABQ5CKQ7_9ASTR
MKQLSLMLTMLIPGPKSPAKDIDVYLQPLIKELQELWKGVWTKDAATGTHFQMKAALLWTINDFPARSSLSGWSGQGYYACPTFTIEKMRLKALRIPCLQNDKTKDTMACVYPRSHGGDAGGTPPRQPNRTVPASAKPKGGNSQYLPLALRVESKLPEAYKLIFPLLLESYFDLASWYNNQDKVVMGHNVYTVGDRIKLGLQLKLRILWPKNKQRIKADHFTRYGSAEEASNHLPLKKVWGDRTEDEWNNLVDWWSHPDRVARSLQNAVSTPTERRTRF